MKKLLSVIMALAMLLSVVTTAGAAYGEHEHDLMDMANMECHYSECTICFELFNVGNHVFKDGACTVCGHYEPKNPFADVAETAWYHDDVVAAVNLNIINGKTANKFAPDDNLTYAEAIKLAACMNQLKTTGNVTLTNGNPWYQTYVDYCKENKIISKQYNYNEKATRAGYIEIFANALPDGDLKKINEIPDNAIPDVPMSASYAPAVYKMYRAGILQGVDAKHNCNPGASIKRSEVAAIITRMTDKSKRITFSMESEKENPTAEEPLFEIPENAEIIPEVPVEITTEAKEETPDMYEAFEIAVQPESIASADEGDKLTYTVRASGGKTPYTYSWGTRDRYNGFTEFTESDYVKGAKTNTLTLVFDIDNSTTSQFCCKITDSLGQEVKSEYVSMPEKVFIFKPESFTKEGNGYTFVGRVDKGAVRVGETVSMHMSDDKVEVYGVVTNIIMFNKNLDEAKQGDYCGIVINEPKKIPYDNFVKENAGETLAERLVAMGNYGFKVPLRVIACMDEADPGEKTAVYVLVSGGKGPYTYKWYRSEGSREFTELNSGSKYTVNGNKVEILVDKNEFESKVTYKCEVTDAAGNTKKSFSMYVIPKTHPYLANQPYDRYANVGDEVEFSVYTRCDTATYQWYIKNDNTIGWKKIETTDTWAKGATTKTLKIQVEKADFVSHCEYRCEIKNGTYGIVSNSAKILPKSMYITANPETIVGKHGEKVQFKVAAEGGKAPYTYQWEFTYPSDVLNGGYLKVYKDYEWAEGETTDTLTVLVDGTKMDSDCKFRCTVTDATGRKMTSKEAYIIISSDASVSFEEGIPKDQTIVIMQ